MEQDEDLLPPPKKLKVKETPVSNNEFKSAVEDTRIEVVESDCDGINRNDETLGSDAEVLGPPLEEPEPLPESSSEEPELEPLPEGWVAVEHESSGELYLHKQSRTCTWSRPFVLGHSAKVKKHRVPVASIPCMGAWLAEQDWYRVLKKHRRIDTQKFKEYLLLRWKDGFPSTSRCSPAKSRVPRKPKEKPKANSDSSVIVPESISKLIELQVPKQYCKPSPDGKHPPKVWKINTSKTTVLSILFEFCEIYLKSKLEYTIKELKSSQTPFACTVVIGGIQYGTGKGVSKKAARQSSAEATLEVFFPGLCQKLLKTSKLITHEEFEFLSTIAIDEPSAIDILEQAGLPAPWAVLRECCQRNKGSGRIGEPNLKIELKQAEEPALTTKDGDQGTAKKSLKTWYHLTCGEDYEVSGACLGRRDGQQLAAQAMLKVLHPHLHTWDALLKLYADTHSKLPRVATEHCLPDLSHCQNSENEQLLHQLKQEMRKLKDSTKIK